MTSASEPRGAAVAATGAVRAEPMAPGLVVVLLAMLLGVQPVTTDLYLPALPGLAADLRAPMAAAQATLAALLFTFGGAQLLLGPAADRFGRRPVLLAGLALYVVASIGSALAAHIAALVAWRALQGVGMAAAVVCARAMVRDLYAPADGARVMSKALSMLGIVALASPLLGGVIATAFGWRAALLGCALFGAAALALVALRLRETVPRRNPRALRLAPMLAMWWHIGRHRVFVAWALLVCCTYGGLFAFLAGSAFVFIDVLGSSRTACGVYIACCSAAYIVGTFQCRRWLPAHGLAGSVKRASWFTLAGGVAMVALALAGVRSPWAIVLPMLGYSFAHGVHQPCGQAAVVGPFPQHAGAASALAGFVLAAGAVGVGAYLGAGMNGTVFPLVLAIGALSLATTLVARTLVQRAQDPR